MQDLMKKRVYKMKMKCTKISLLQHQPRQQHKHQHRETSSMYQGSSPPPSMIIEIEQDEDIMIEVDNPYPQIGVEVVSKGTMVSKRHVSIINIWGLSFSSCCLK